MVKFLLFLLKLILHYLNTDHYIMAIDYYNYFNHFFVFDYKIGILGKDNLMIANIENY